MMQFPAHRAHALAHHFNSLITTLPARERLLLAHSATAQPLTLHPVAGGPASQLSSVLFPLSGFVSLVVKLNDAPGLEVGMVGNEGMVGVALALGGKSVPWHIVVQGEGDAMGYSARLFGQLLPQCPTLRQRVHRYANVLLAQTATLCACNRFHSVQQRLARWLLMTQDRAHSAHFLMTQEFLAYMLGVRRVSVTQAASHLQRASLIRYHRGDIEILDRLGLERAACSCYQKSQDAYADAFGGLTAT
jgi:CRP-like cAMP-binding protein